jgi:large subunit ribosomal protein L29
MNTKDIRELSLPELEKKIRDTKEELLKLRLGKNTGELEHPSEIKRLTRQNARLQTIASEKRKAAAAA